MAKRNDKKAMDLRIEKVYRERCSGVQVNMMDIGKIFFAGYDAIAEGVDDQELGNRIAAFVETIRRN